MNEPIKKLGVQSGQAVYLLNGREESLHTGFTPTVVYLGHDAEGKHVFAPTRRQRRYGLQKAKRNRTFGLHVHHWQVVRDEKGNIKRIPHFFNRPSQSSHE